MEDSRLRVLKAERRTSRIRGVNIGKKSYKAFSFSVISLTGEHVHRNIMWRELEEFEDNEEVGDQVYVPDIGSLSVKFIRAELESDPSLHDCSGVHIPGGPVYEGVNKGKTHRVQSVFLDT